MAKDYISTKEAADLLGVTSARRIRQLLEEGVLAGRMHGRDWLVEKTSAMRLKKEREKGKK